MASARKQQRGYFELDLKAYFIFLICAGVAFGIALALVMPWVWSWIKPLIHQLTA